MIDLKKIGIIMLKTDELELDGLSVRLLLYVLKNTNDFGYCEKSNQQISEHFDVSERSITGSVSILASKGLIRIVQNRHKHKRMIYVQGLSQAQRYREEPPIEAMTPGQKKFKELFPDRTVDCDIPIGVDIDQLLEEMKKSTWIMTKAHNMTLKSCCITHYKLIMSGHYRDEKFIEKTSSFSTKRTYSSNELNSLFQDVDDIEI